VTWTAHTARCAALSIALLAGCTLLDRQAPPEILAVDTNYGTDPTVGRGRSVAVTVYTHDPDNDELDFTWVLSGGSFTGSDRDTLIDLFQDSVTVVWNAPGEPGTYDLHLQVGDGQSGEVVTTAIRVTVTQAPPTADAGQDQLVAFEDTLIVNLDGTGSHDPDGDDLRFEWGQIAGPAVQFDETSELPTFRAPAPADYVFELRVSDDLAPGESYTSDVVSVTIRVSDRGGRSSE